MASFASAEAGPRDHARMLVRAWGTSGSVERVQASEPSALGSDVQAGTIPRALLRAELDRGIGRFLQNVRVQAAVSHGHFAGWKLVSLFAKRPDVRVSVLQAGDVLLRVNGTSIERPEELKDVWDTLGDATEITLEIERNGQPSTLHYAISG